MTGWMVFGGRFGRKPFSDLQEQREEEMKVRLNKANLFVESTCRLMLWLMYANRVIGTGLDHLCWTKMLDSDGISMGFGALPARVCFDTPKLTSNAVLNLTQFGSYYPRFFITLVRCNFASLEVCDFRRSLNINFQPLQKTSKSEFEPCAQPAGFSGFRGENTEAAGFQIEI